MADNKKIYTIQINGIDQSIKQVDALSDALKALDAKIKELESRSVSVTSSSNGGGGNRTAELNAEDKLLKQIQSTEEQISNARSEDYQRLVEQKDILKDIVSEAQERAAAERLSNGNYGNTMKGLKQELSDIKKVMQTTDLGDEKFQEMTQRANELTSKLKELEQAYGQFGRNVGNYKSAFDDVKKVTVQVGNTTREFNSVRDASRQLTQELKAMVIAGKEDTQEYKELAEALHNFEMASRRAESAVNDLKASSQGMDDILDMMESFGALGQISQGFSAFFGFDNTEIERSIQKLVALQNVMQGIEKIRQQMNTGEGIGKIFQGGNQAIDSFVAKLTGAKIGINGLTKGSKVATIAVRGLSTALKGIGIGFVIEGITMLISVLDKYTSEASKAELATESLGMELNALNKAYELRIDMLSASYMRQEISTNEYLAELFKEQGENIKKNTKYINDMAKAMGRLEWTDYLKPSTYLNVQSTGYTGNRISGDGSSSIKDAFHDIGELDFSKMFKDVKEAEEEFEKLNKAILNGNDYLDEYGDGIKDWLGSLAMSVGDTKDVLIGVGNTIASDYINKLTEAFAEWSKAQSDVASGVDGAQAKVDEAKKKVKELYAQMNSSDAFQSFLVNMDKYIPDAAVREKLQKMLGDMQDFYKNAAEDSEQWVHFWNNKRIAAMADGNAKINAQIEEDLRHETVLYGNSAEHRQILEDEANRKRLNQQEKYNEQARNKAKQHAKEVEAAEKELNSLRIQNMAEGLSKQLAQLEEERRQRIQKAKENGIKVGEITAEVNKLYDKKVLEAKEEWSYKIQQVYTNMWKNIYQINHQNAQMDFEDQLNQLELEYKALQDAAAKNSGTALGGYSNQGFSITKTKKKRAEEGSTDSSDYKYDVLIEKDIDYTKRLREEFKKRTEDRRAYYAETEKLTIEELDKQYKIESEKAAENYNNEWRTLVNSYNAQDHELEEHLKKGEITQAQCNEASKRLTEERTRQESLLQIRFNTETEKREREHQEKIVNAQNESNMSVLNNYQEMLDKLNSIDSSSIVTNGIGFMNIVATRKRNKELIDAYKELSANITAEINNLEDQLKSDDLTAEQRKQINQLITMYNQLQVAIGGTVIKIQEDTKKATEEFISRLNQYVQAFGDTLQTVLSAVWDAQDAAYEKQVEELDKAIDTVKEKYDEMNALAEEHKDNMVSLEDQIKTAQGDARDHLLARYNAEMQAQRQALKEKQKAEKEEEKLQAKKEKMDLEQRKRQKKRDLIQAAINAAMAISMAAVNTWPVPAIPMMAAAAVAGAAQIAAIQAQNYAHGGTLPNKEGGLAQGNRHRDGGIKVLGGSAEIEGGEFITNRLTTQKNIDLLEYINSKKKKINIDDLIEFYGGNSPVRKNIQTVRTKFADGGMIPTLRNDIALNDRMIQAMEDYSNRPVQVAVVDIIDRTQQVNNVKVMAGLDV